MMLIEIKGEAIDNEKAQPFIGLVDTVLMDDDEYTEYLEQEAEKAAEESWQNIIDSGKIKEYEERLAQNFGEEWEQPDIRKKWLKIIMDRYREGFKEGFREGFREKHKEMASKIAPNLVKRAMEQDKSLDEALSYVADTFYLSNIGIQRLRAQFT